jgi:elongation factor Tu
MGLLERGTMKYGMDVELLGHERHIKTGIQGLRMFYRTLEEARAGDLVSACLRGVKKDDIKRGMVLVKPGSVQAHDHIKARMYFLKKEEGGLEEYPPTTSQSIVHSMTFDAVAQMTYSDKDFVNPGEENMITLKLAKPMVLEKGMRLMLRNGLTTYGAGIVSEICPDLSADERKKLAKGKTKEEKEAFKNLTEKRRAQ